MESGRVSSSGESGGFASSEESGSAALFMMASLPSADSPVVLVSEISSVPVSGRLPELSGTVIELSMLVISLPLLLSVAFSLLLELSVLSIASSSVSMRSEVFPVSRV